MSLQPFKPVRRERQILSIGESHICTSSGTKRRVCSTQNHRISPKMPVSLSLGRGGVGWGQHYCDEQMVKITEFLCASNMTSALRVPPGSCGKGAHAGTKEHVTISG